MTELHERLQRYVTEYMHFTHNQLEMELVKVTRRKTPDYNADRSVAIRGIQVARKRGYLECFGVKLSETGYKIPHIPEEARMTVFHADRK